MSQLKQVRNESLADCLLSQAKAPVGGKLSVAGNQERIQDAPVQTNNYSPGIIPKKVIVLILTSTVVCVDIGICLAKPKVLKKVMD